MRIHSNWLCQNRMNQLFNFELTEYLRYVRYTLQQWDYNFMWEFTSLLQRDYNCMWEFTSLLQRDYNCMWEFTSLLQRDYNFTWEFTSLLQWDYNFTWEFIKNSEENGNTSNHKRPFEKKHTDHVLYSILFYSKYEDFISMSSPPPCSYVVVHGLTFNNQCGPLSHIYMY